MDEDEDEGHHLQKLWLGACPSRFSAATIIFFHLQHQYSACGHSTTHCASPPSVSSILPLLSRLLLFYFIFFGSSRYSRLSRQSFIVKKIIRIFFFFCSSPKAPAFPIRRHIISSRHSRPSPSILFNTTPSLISATSSSSYSLLQILHSQPVVIFCKVQFDPPKSVVLDFALPRPATDYLTYQTRLICCTNLSKGPLPCLTATHQLPCYLGHPCQPSLRVQKGRRSLREKKKHHSLTVKTCSESLHGIKQLTYSLRDT